MKEKRIKYTNIISNATFYSKITNNDDNYELYFMHWLQIIYYSIKIIIINGKRNKKKLRKMNFNEEE